MKRKVYIFIIFLFIGLLVVPAFNIFSEKNINSTHWRKKSFLYNIDFTLKWASFILYRFGMSTDPKQVIVGKNGWFFLGDAYEYTLTEARRAPTDADHLLAKKIAVTAQGWASDLSNQGVKVFKIMVGPNKGTIYPEYMPAWARPFSPGVTDVLFEAVGSNHYLDLRPALLEFKANNPEPIYYKTDTHWNFLGASIAFREFSKQIAKEAPEILWPQPEWFQVDRKEIRYGGDLAKFLRLSDQLPDFEPILRLSTVSTNTTLRDFDSQTIVGQGGNPALISPTKPLWVQARGALNLKRVLWLRDSFGTAISPWMAATFSDVLQVHWGEVIGHPGRLSQLVDRWKPDYVFITVVERAARNEAFAVQ
jgi:hypothetical protein